MDKELVETIAEATDIHMNQPTKAIFWIDNFLHRAKNSLSWRWERSSMSDTTLASIKFLFDRESLCTAAMLSHQPPVFLVPIGGARPLRTVETISAYYSNTPALFFLLIYWSLEDQHRVNIVKANAELHRSRFPQHRLVFFCNTSEEQRLIDAAGLEAVVLNHNQLVSEDTFRPIPDAQLKYDAVYNAKIARFKRHYLAADIERMLYVTYRCPSDMSVSAGRAYVRRILARSPEHQFANSLVNDLPTLLTRDEVNKSYSEASVGLCLSPTEGAMYASIEYLFAGLPIVSTPNYGGRDAFFDDEFCLTVKPDCREIRDAVNALRDRKIPRQYVRNRTIERVKAARRASLSTVERLIEQYGADLPVERIWPLAKGVDSMSTSSARGHIYRWQSGG